MSGRISGNKPPSKTANEDGAGEPTQQVRVIKPENARFETLASMVKKVQNQKPFSQLPSTPLATSGATGFAVVAAIAGGTEVSNPLFTDGVRYLSQKGGDPPVGEVGTEWKAEMEVKCSCGEKGDCNSEGNCESLDYEFVLSRWEVTSTGTWFFGLLSNDELEWKDHKILDEGTLELSDGESKVISGTYTPTQDDVTLNKWADTKAKKGDIEEFQVGIRFPNDEFWSDSLEIVEKFEDIPEDKRASER